MNSTSDNRNYRAVKPATSQRCPLLVKVDHLTEYTLIQWESGCNYTLLLRRANLSNVRPRPGRRQTVVQIRQAISLFNIRVVIPVPPFRANPLTFPIDRVRHDERVFHGLAVVLQLDALDDLELIANGDTA